MAHSESIPFPNASKPASLPRLLCLDLQESSVIFNGGGTQAAALK